MCKGSPLFISAHSKDCQIIPTFHAIDKYMQICSCKNRVRAKNRLIKMLKKSRPVQIDPVHRVKRILNNGMTPADYYEFSEYRFAVVELKGKIIILTFEKKFK